MRTSDRRINTSLKSQITKTFAQLLADLKDIKESEAFLHDFFNDSELETFAKRLAVAYWLKKGKSYLNTRENLKVSTATIATVQALAEKPGFKLALKKLEAEEWANVWAEKIKKFTKI